MRFGRRWIWTAGLVLAGAHLGAGCAHAGAAKAVQGGPPAEYRIGREDVLEVSVWHDPELSRVVPVRPDGRISLPLLGEIAAANRTAPEVAAEIEQRLVPYVDNPRVSVILHEINAARFFVMGEVMKPGVYPLRDSITVLQGLAEAGGLGQFADSGGIVVIRQASQGAERIPVPYSDLVEGDGKGFYLSSGDTIYVP